MRTIVPVIILAALAAPAASAQPSRERKPDKPALSLPLHPKPVVNPCAEYGLGFVKIEGSSTCMKIGGSFGIGVGGSR